MGFMAGFGTGFSNTFNAAQNRKAEKERDAFRVAYDTFNSRKSAYDEAKAKDEQYLAQAKELVGMVGAPIEAIPNVAEKLRADVPYKDVKDWLTTTKFAAPQQADDIPATPTMDTSMEAQTANSGLSAPASPIGNPNAFQDAGTFITNLLDPAKRQEARMNQANTQVQEAMGLDPEEFDAIMGGYTPQSQPLAEVTSSTYGTEAAGEDPFGSTRIILAGGKRYDAIKAPDGNWETSDGKVFQPSEVTQTFTEDGWKSYEDAREFLGAQADELMAKKTNVVNVASDATKLISLVDKNKNVLNIVGSGSELINDAITNLVAVYNAAGSMGSAEFQQAEEDLINNVIDTFGGVNQDAVDYAVFQSLQIKFAFAVARANNGDGGQLSNADVQNAMKQFSTTDPVAFKKQLQQYVSMAATAYNNEAEITLNGNRATRASENWVDVESMFGKIDINEIMDMSGVDAPVSQDTTSTTPTTETPEAAPKDDEIPEGVELKDFLVTPQAIEALKKRGITATEGEEGWKMYMYGGKLYLIKPDGSTINI